MITRKEFADWKEHKLTQRMFEKLTADRQVHNEYLLEAVPNHQAKENCLVLMGKLIGNINAINHILSMTYESMMTREEEEADKNE